MERIAGSFPNIDPDAFIIMPNHIHGIIVLVGTPLVGAHSENGIHPDNGTHVATVDRATTRVAPTLGNSAPRPNNKEMNYSDNCQLKTPRRDWEFVIFRFPV